MKLTSRLAPAVAALLLTAACEDNPFVIGKYGVAGRWTGSTAAGAGADTVRFFFDLELEQDRAVLSGAGEVRGGSARFPVDVTGTWAAGSGAQADVSLRLLSAEAAPLAYVARFDVDTVPRAAPDTGLVVVTDTDTLVGTLAGSGLDNVVLRLGRTAP